MGFEVLINFLIHSYSPPPPTYVLAQSVTQTLRQKFFSLVLNSRVFGNVNVAHSSFKQLPAYF